MNTLKSRGLYLFGAATLMASPLLAQSGAEKNDDIFELSPFTVDAAEDQGYRAQNTLSGTRLKSSLSDVGASISVMTKELLDDIGATDINDAFLYSTSTENEDEYASNDTEGLSITTTNSNRVRGIASSTYSRGFFDTNVRGDSYNTERFTMAYGPNAILYGLGSPAGIVDATTKQASVAKNFGEAAYRFDNNSSGRVSFDYNRVLLEGKLAARIAIMDQDKRSWKQPDSDKENRFYGTLTFKPAESAVIRYSYESMKNDRKKSRSSLPEQSVAQWLANGKPLYDHLNNQLTYDNGATWTAAPRLANGNVDAKALYAMGINYQSGSNRRVQVNGGYEPTAADWAAIQDPAQRAAYEKYGIQAMRWYQTAEATGYEHDQVTERDTSLLPLDYSITGLSTIAQFNSDSHTVTWEQKVAKNLYFELAYNNESYDRNSFDPLRSSGENLRADVNYYLPTIVNPDAALGSIVQMDHNNAELIKNADGSFAAVRNPNAGRFYAEGQGIGYNQYFDFESYRATASYELDLTENNEWFGKHSIALLYQRDDKEERYMKTNHFNADDTVVRGIAFGENNIINRYYIDPPLVGTNGQAGNPYPSEFTTSSGDWTTYVNAAGSFLGNTNLRELEGKMVVLQSRLLKNRLIATAGFRNDKETVYQAFDTGATTGIESYPEIPDTQAFPTNSGSTKTTGVVFKATEWLKFFYNKSDSFLPQSHLHDYYNNPIPPADGEGKDIGVMLDLMDGKLFARASWFEQTATGALEIDWTYEIMKWRLVNGTEVAIERWAAVLPSRPEWAAQHGLSVDDVFRPEINDNLRSIRDFKSEGMEIELIAKPTRNLDLRLTFAKTEPANSRTLPNLQKYVEDRLPIWKKYELLAIRPDLASRVKDPADPSKDTVYGTTRGQLIGNTNTIGYNMYVQNTGLPRLSFAKEEEGSVSARARKYRANFIANYNFTEGRLKGFGIGTGVRYRSKAAIGYEGKPNPFFEELLLEEPDLASKVDPLSLLTADITKPIYGESQLNIDAWLKYNTQLNFAGRNIPWRIQMNIQNLLDDDERQPLTADNSGRVTRWSSPAPRTVAITNTFKF